MLRVFSYAQQVRSFTGLMALFIATFALHPVNAQVGSRLASSGSFTFENAEDLDLSADALERDWLSDFVNPAGDVLSVLNLQTAGLSLAAGQSPVGALQASVPTDQRQGAISGGFGIPFPGVVGASTLDYPGNMASFTYLGFVACFQRQGATGARFSVEMECYPGNGDGTYPKVGWQFTPAEGQTFQQVLIDLRQPDYINENPLSLSVDELISKTRFLYFYAFDAPTIEGEQITFQVDDIQLIPDPQPASGIAGTNAQATPLLLIDDVEDVDLSVETLGRDYMVDSVAPEGPIVAAEALSGNPSTAAEQTPVGALRVVAPDDGAGAIDADFGVLLAASPGDNPNTFPARIDSYRYMSFYARFDNPNIANPGFTVSVDCFPRNSDGSYPRLAWFYAPVFGNTFAPVNLTLRNPDAVLNNPGSIPVSELLTRTGLLRFEFTASPAGSTDSLNGHIDDIRLGMMEWPPETKTEGWDLYE